MIPTRSGGWWSSMPPVTKNLIIINIAVWLVEVLAPASVSNGMLDFIGLRFWGSGGFNPLQLFTYMFAHSPDSIFHLLFNMFTLWMFGRIVESTWGSRRFLVYYLLCGLGAALTQEVVWQLTWLHDYASHIAPLNGLNTQYMEQIISSGLAQGDTQWISGADMYKSSMVTIGASGAVFGLLLGFAFTFPDMPLYLFFIPVPIKAKYMVLGYGVVEFFLGISGSQSTVAHFAHLGGLLFGLVILLWWRHSGRLRAGWQRRRREAGAGNVASRMQAGGFDISKLEDKRRLNELLDKIARSGYASLSAAEQEELRRLSERLK